MPFIDEQLVANGTTTLGRIIATKAILDIITNDAVLTLAVNVGGTGYVVGETFDVDGGTVIASNPAFNARGVVTAEAAGVVTAVKITSAGAYSTLPGAVGQTTSNSSAAGNNDLTVDLTTQVAQWTQDRSTYTTDDADFEWICTSIKATNAPTIGHETFEVTAFGAARNIVATGFSAPAAFDSQPGTSPQPNVTSIPGTDPRLYVSVDERRVNICHRDGAFSRYASLGLFIPFTDTEANYPFPGAAFGGEQVPHLFASTMVRSSNTPSLSIAGIVNAAPNNTGVLNPHLYRDNLSAAWLGIAELTSNGGNSHRSQMWPQKQGFQDYDFTFAPEVSGFQTNPQSANAVDVGIFSDNFSSSDTGWFENPNATGSAGVQGVALVGTGGRLTFLVEAHIVSNQVSDVQVIGIVDGFQACHGIGLTAFEEIITEAGRRFLVFNDTNSADAGHWVAMEKL